MQNCFFLLEPNFVIINTRLTGGMTYIIRLKQQQQNALALEHASEEMKGDRELCTAAVTQNGMALQWAREEIKDDWGIVSAAIKETGAAFAYASPRIRNNKELRKALAVNDSDFAWASLSKTRETIERTIEG